MTDVEPPPVQPLDLGHGHTLRFTSWSPDRALNPQYDGLPDVERWGAIIGHPAGPHPFKTNPAGYCEGGITFDGEVQRQLTPERAMWTVESWEPLTLSPSIQCACGDHGFVRAGRWEPA